MRDIQDSKPFNTYNLDLHFTIPHIKQELQKKKKSLHKCVERKKKHVHIFINDKTNILTELHYVQN